MIDFDAIHSEVAEGFISVQRHPSADLRIYNYTQRAQFSWRWTPETKVCRGLIVDANQNIVARPFQKFFSYEQLNGVVPSEPFEVFEKLDGSLGILYWVGDEPWIATRGSFTSDQAQWATAHFRKHYANLPFERSLTYLFEIIYPANRVVVDYGDTADLFLLAVIDTATGKDVPLPALDMPTVKRFDGVNDFGELLSKEESNKEGFVVRFESGERVKLKFAEYKRLHRLITGINARHIWEEMQLGSIDHLIDRVPDEFFEWVRKIQGELTANYTAIESRAKADFKVLETRKDTALYYQTCPYPSILFAMMDGKDYSGHIWKLIKPKAELPFKVAED